METIVKENAFPERDTHPRTSDRDTRVDSKKPQLARSKERPLTLRDCICLIDRALANGLVADCPSLNSSYQLEP
jgi:hypothetical protein